MNSADETFMDTFVEKGIQILPCKRNSAKANFLKTIFLLFIFSFLSFKGFSQDKQPDPEVKKDSALIYKKIQDFAYRRKFTHWLFRGVFREVKTEVAVVSSKVKVQKIVRPENFIMEQGKAIRSIRIIVIDPLGQIEGDTVAVAHSWAERIGNKSHVRTLRLTIKNQLLFNEGELLDSVKLTESERLLRQDVYLREAKIKLFFTSKKKDSIDVVITVRDLWTFAGSARISQTSNSMEFSEKNFLGLSHQFRNEIHYNAQTAGSFSSAGNYLVPNIHHSFVAATVFYNASAYNKGVGISFDRVFFSPLTRWAGGIALSTNHSLIPYVSPDHALIRIAAQYHAEDFWIGRGFNVHNDKFNVKKDPRILLTSRVYNMQYLKRPSFAYDSLQSNHGRAFYLSSISFSTRNYYQDKDIYGFSKVEDVPEGKLFAIIGGFQKNEFESTRPYYGFKFSYSKHIYPLGYLAMNFEYGSFIHEGKTEKGVVNTGIYFFNDLLKFGRWGIRQLVDFHITSGINRSPLERININGNNGLEGFNSDVLKGYDRGIVTFADVIYLPYKWIGFQFAVVLFASLARIGETNSDLFSGRIYQGYGLGLLLKNEFLVVRNIQFSFGYYPQIPGNGNDIFKYNALKVTDLKYNDLYFSKPEFVGYN
jgi:hypothetical protein